MCQRKREPLGGGRHFNMRNVLLPQEGIRVVKQAPLRPWTPVWFQFVGQEGEEEGEAAPLALRTHCKKKPYNLETHS